MKTLKTEEIIKLQETKNVKDLERQTELYELPYFTDEPNGACLHIEKKRKANRGERGKNRVQIRDMQTGRTIRSGDDGTDDKP